MPFSIGDHVRYKHHYPADTWDVHLWWVCGKTTDEDHWRTPVILYRLARLSDENAYGLIRTCVHETMMELAQERYSDEETL